MEDLIVDLDDTTVQSLLRRAFLNRRSLNDEMLAILREAVSDDPAAPGEGEQPAEFTTMREVPGFEDC